MSTVCRIYENFSFDNPFFTLNLIIWSVYAGFMIAGIGAVYNKNYLGKPVRALCAAGAYSPQSALTLADLGIKPSGLLKRALREGGALGKYVYVANPDECRVDKPHSGFLKRLGRFLNIGVSDGVRYDLAAARLYVPEKPQYRAQVRYDKKGSSPALLIVAAVAFLALAAALTFLLPELLGFTDSMISMYKNIK